jgi:glycosyltransferase involved in cell wall biosynthesis
MLVPPTVCHVSTAHSGVEVRIVRKELATLVDAGFAAAVIIPLSDEEELAVRALGIEPLPLRGATGRGRAWRMLALPPVAAWHAWRTGARIVHFHDPEFIPAGLALKLLGRAVVMDVHEDFLGFIKSKHWIWAPLRNAVARLTRGVELFAASRFDAVVAAVPAIADAFESHARRLVVVGNFPRLDEFVSVEAAEVEARRDALAYVGSISTARGIGDVVRALPSTGVRLQLAGRWSSEADRASVGGLPGWSMVDEHGWIDRDGIRALLSRCFAGVCTLHPVSSFEISEPIKIFEYLAAGIPCIASDFPLWRRMLGSHDCIVFVDPTDPVAIAGAINRLRSDPALARRMGENGRRAVLDRFNWNAQGEALVELYRSLSFEARSERSVDLPSGDR